MVRPSTPFGEKSAISIIKRDVMECNLPFRGDTYDGCYHNCIYCYARCQKEFRNIWYTDNPRPADIFKLKNRFSSGFSFRGIGRKGDTYYVDRTINHRFPIRLGTQVDCFQKCEKEYRVTYEFMKYLVEHNYPFMINTKSDLVAEDEYVDLMKKANKGYVVVQITLTSLDPIIRKVELRAPSPERRLHALKVLSDQGIPTQVRYSPIIPMLDYDAEDLLKQAAEYGAIDIITEYLRLSPLAAKRFNENIGLNLVKNVYEPHGHFSKSYYRLNKDYKFKRYKELKKTAERFGLNFYVCSEEDPSINNCENCCGTDKYCGFDNNNTAAANNIYRLIRKKGELTLSDVKRRFWNIHWKEFERRWNGKEVETFLVNVEVKKIDGQEARDEEGNLIYVYKED